MGKIKERPFTSTKYSSSSIFYIVFIFYYNSNFALNNNNKTHITSLFIYTFISQKKTHKGNPKSLLLLNTISVLPYNYVTQRLSVINFLFFDFLFMKNIYLRTKSCQ